MSIVFAKSIFITFVPLGTAHLVGENMQETEFIKQNKDKWQEFEEILGSSDKDPDRLTNLFIETTDDLSYSRTFYSNRSVRVYLNGIAQQVYQVIYKHRKKSKGAIKRFWQDELPATMWYSRKALLYCAILFGAGLLIGTLSSMYYPDFAKIILGDGYVQMTQANIDHGDPMAVYKDSEPLEMFFRIALNNIRLSYVTFVLGILFGIGTYYIVFYNAVMVAAFTYFFIERGLMKEMFLSVMLHGTMELSMIIMAGCAGIALARGLLFPGTYRRIDALIQSARNGIKIMIAVTLFLFYAAFIESFATRITDIPELANGKLIIDIARAIVILGSLAVVVGYFVWYPWYRHKKGHIPEQEAEELAPDKDKQIDISAIKSSGTLFTEAFGFFSASARKLSYFAMVFGLVVVVYFGWKTELNFNGIFKETYFDFNDYNPFGRLWVWSSYYKPINFFLYPELSAVLIIGMTFWLLYIHYLQEQLLGNKTTYLSFLKKNIGSCLVVSVTIMSLFLLPGWATSVLMVIVLPLLFFWLKISIAENKFALVSLGRVFSVRSKSGVTLHSIFFLTLSIIWIGMFFQSTGLSGLILNFIVLNLPADFPLRDQLYTIMDVWILFVLPALLFPIMVYAINLFYYSAREVSEAPELLAHLDQVGYKKRAYGLEKES
jgi:uncharacterized membrane protein SpoIIM required for sporulation